MDVRELGSMGLVVVVAAIILSMGASILASLQATQTANTLQYNITGKGLTGLGTFGDWLPLIALVVVASIVIGVIVGYLGKSSGAV
jgi:hypothetical protein